MNRRSDAKQEDDNYVTDKVFYSILHEIRNMKPLTPEMMRSINDMTSDDKMEIIRAYQDVVEFVKTLFD